MDKFWEQRGQGSSRCENQGVVSQQNRLSKIVELSKGDKKERMKNREVGDHQGSV